MQLQGFWAVAATSKKGAIGGSSGQYHHASIVVRMGHRELGIGVGRRGDWWWTRIVGNQSQASEVGGSQNFCQVFFKRGLQCLTGVVATIITLVLGDTQTIHDESAKRTGICPPCPFGYESSSPRGLTVSGNCQCTCAQIFRFQGHNHITTKQLQHDMIRNWKFAHRPLPHQNHDTVFSWTQGKMILKVPLPKS